MSERQGVKRYGLLSLAVLFLLFGAAILIFEHQNFAISALGLLAILGSTQLAQKSRVHAKDRGPVPANGEWIDLTGARRPGGAMWFMGIALLLLAGLSFWILHLDALHGGHAVWPVFLFAAAALCCAGVWAYIVTKLLNQHR